MPLRLTRLPFVCVLLTVLTACEKEEYPFYDGPGKRPVYVPASSLADIRNLPEQPVEQTGTIFLLNDLFFMLEQRKGIHVYSVNNAGDVQYMTFIKIPAVTDFTVNGNLLYADSWRDLLTLDISNLLSVDVLNRQTDVFSPLLFPPLYSGFFECVDETKGAVIDWEDAELENAACRTVF